MADQPHQQRTGAGFPATRASLVARVRSDDPDVRRRAYAALVQSYWRPVYTYLRLRWKRGAEEAQDLTQDFLLRVIEKEFLQAYEPGRARLRTFVRVCLDRFVQNAERDASRIKRGGRIEIQSLDFATAEGELPRLELPDPTTGEAFFEREWIRSFFRTTVEAFRHECIANDKEIHFTLLERYDLEEDPPTYEALGRELGLSATEVTNRLAWARRTFRRLVLERLHDLTGDGEEFRLEARSLLGVDVA